MFVAYMLDPTCLGSVLKRKKVLEFNFTQYAVS